MNARRVMFYFTILFTLSLLSNCQNKKVPENEIVARVGDEFLTRVQLSDWMPPNLSDEQKAVLSRQYIDRWVQKAVMAAAARDDRITLTPYETWSMEFLQKEMLSQKYLNAKLPRDIIVTDEEISSYYDEKKEQFIRSEDEIHLVQLFLENLDGAISQEIREGKSLLEVIKRNYLELQGKRILEKNGDLGYVPIKFLRKEIVRIARTGNTGRIYGPINLENGYYYFQMMDKQAAGTYRSLDLVQDEIRLRVSTIKREGLADDLTRKMIEKYKVKTFPENLK